MVEARLRSDSTGIFHKFSPFYLVEILKLWSHAKTILADSYGFENMWIIKPAGVSRGSGIQITSDMSKMFQLRFGKIVQKYIEFPLLLDCGRKFDIRQWILVKSFTPLRVFAFNKCYARFSSVRYTNDKYENMQKHLTNYSQNK
jgi:tubulin monoglycylase TTLL3/8